MKEITDKKDHSDRRRRENTEGERNRILGKTHKEKKFCITHMWNSPCPNTNEVYPCSSKKRRKQNNEKKKAFIYLFKGHGGYFASSCTSKAGIVSF